MTIRSTLPLEARILFSSFGSRGLCSQLRSLAFQAAAPAPLAADSQPRTAFESPTHEVTTAVCVSSTTMAQLPEFIFSTFAYRVSNSESTVEKIPLRMTSQSSGEDSAALSKDCRCSAMTSLTAVLTWRPLGPCPSQTHPAAQASPGSAFTASAGGRKGPRGSRACFGGSGKERRGGGGGEEVNRVGLQGICFRSVRAFGPNGRDVCKRADRR
mmetsp:Transcript_16441/g.39032  ORF Transcript_16441/g.39032 Transcript_16441/m.39032 type:complete len:213 (-) Transcript_16441:136-774(-)